ncbi:MAG: FTR1 family protein [Erysipelotrichaceae bacterium]
METFIPGLIMGFREGLEAFLIISIILQYLNHIQRTELKKNVVNGAIGGVAASLLIGGMLYWISLTIQKTDEISKIWESTVSLVALGLITTFIVWMIKHGQNMVGEVQDQVKRNISKAGLFSVAFIMVVREGTEIAIFTFAGQYTLVSISIGIAAAFALSILIYNALIKVNLRMLFNMTLAYLILQAGFLLGYAVHEGLSAMKVLGILDGGHFIYAKAFDFSSTLLDHKQGGLGLPLYVAFGWYSRPEWIQFILQYAYTIGLFAYWKKTIQSR